MSGSHSRIEHCGIPQCKLCKNNQLDRNTIFFSNLGKKKFECEFHQNCKTNIIIYLISCRNPSCCMKYVGRTYHAINRRLSLHRANILRGTEGPAMLQHFTKIHQPSDMIIKAIEICSSANIKERERFWIAELNTAFPYGLNDRVNHYPIQDAYNYTLENNSINKAVYEIFNKNPSRRTKKGGISRNHGNRNNLNSIFNPMEFMESLNSPDADGALFFINFVRNKIMNLNKPNSKALFLHLSICINEHNELFENYIKNEYCAYLPYLVRDISFAKLKSSSQPKKSQHYVIIQFCNKFIDNLNINKIFNNNMVSNLFPNVADNSMKIPSISYRYSSTIRSKITNYKEVINAGITPTQCNCDTHDGSFKDANSGHVLTGKLDIIENTELRTLLKKGLNFREVPSANKTTVYKTIVSSIDSYINKISDITKTPILQFKPWKMEILKQIHERLGKLNLYRHNNVLSKKCNIDELKRLQEHWVFIATDKASNNITVVCKKHYMNILDNEILNSGNFVEMNNNADSIIENQSNFLKRFNLIPSKNIPFLFWTAKLHKNPTSHRFITSGRNCTTQPLSINIGYCLKEILNIIRSNSKFHRKKTGINTCFIIDNREQVTNFMKHCNQKKNVHSVSTFDFKTLYTSIPLDKLKSKLALVIRRAFNSRNKKFICVTGKRASLCDNKKSSFSLSVHQLIECVNFIIDHSFIVYKGKIFKQCIGIPMGTNCAPYLANLFLYAYEMSYIEDKSRVNQQIAINLADVFRFQDDSIVFNDQDTFLAKWREIYPIEMQLEQTNTGNTCTFLDLRIEINNGKFIYKSYDKRQDFDFNIINYPDLHGNVPVIPSYGVFTSQLIRFCEINGDTDNFKSDVLSLMQKLVIQNFDITVLKAKFRKFYSTNIIRWSKFGYDIEKFLDSS